MSWDLVSAYLAVCVSIAWVVMHLSFLPALDMARNCLVDNEFTRHPNIAVFTQFVLCTLFAPVFILVAIIPGTWASYVAATSRIVLEPREI